MNKLKLIVLLSITGALLGFSLWPVLSGIDIAKSCENPNADCALPEQKTPRIVYLLEGQQFNDPGSGFTSRSEYCRLSNTCTPETMAVPLSIFIGAVAGGIGGFIYLRTKVRRKS